MSKPTGWMMRNRNPHRDGPVVPCRWEAMLRKRGLEESRALENPRLVAKWVRANERYAFVPEVVLEALQKS